MIKLKLKDGSIREIQQAMPASEIIKDIGMGLYKAACCVKLDGQVFDMRTVVDHDCEFEVMTFDSKAGKETFWHTASHLMAQAVKNLYPEAKLARGPLPKLAFTMISRFQNRLRLPIWRRSILRNEEACQGRLYS